MAFPKHPVLAFPIAAAMVVMPSALIGLLMPSAGWAAAAMVAVSLTALWQFARWYGAMRVFWLWSLAVLSSAILWAAGLGHLQRLWRLGPRPTTLSVADVQAHPPELPCYVELSGILRPDYEHSATFTATYRDHKGNRSSSTDYESATPLVGPDWRATDAVPVLITRLYWGATVRPVTLQGILDVPQERGGSIGVMAVGWLNAKPPRFRWDPATVLVFHPGSIQERFRGRLGGDLLITLILVGVTWGIGLVFRRAGNEPAPPSAARSVPANGSQRPATSPPPPDRRAKPATVAPTTEPASALPVYTFGYEPIANPGTVTDLSLGTFYPPGSHAQYDYPSELGAIGPYIADLTALRQLSVDSDALTALPDALMRLTILERLHLRAPHLAGRLPDLSRLTALKDLSLTAGLTDVPPELSRLSHLTDLSLRNNALERLPDSMSALTALTRLDLRGNRFDELPAVLTRLPQLRHVDLRDNRIPPSRLKALQAALGKGCKLLL